MDRTKLIEILKNHELWLKTRFNSLVKGERADLRGADLCNANLCNADLCNADLCNADLRGANLCNADLRNAIGIPINCPESGSFIGYKKAFVNDGNFRTPVIVKLRITENAKRSSATGRKCRCNEAEVLEIKSINESLEFESAISDYDSEFIYKVGKTVRVDNFEENRFVECAPGIHFFITRQEAIDY